MKYSDEFIEMLEKAEREHQYVGTGNPDASILIIGQELAIDETNQKQVENELYSNVPKWKENINNHVSQECVPVWNNAWSDEEKSLYLNPLYLYKKMIPNSEGHTWSKYQKLMDMIRDVEHTKVTNFQEFAFITEYNLNPSKSNLEQDREKRKESILKRDEFFRTTAFFQKFPIVIVAAGNYAGNNFDVYLEQTFNVKWKSLFEVRDGDIFEIKPGDKLGKACQWYSLHYNSDKLVVHTRQLSSAITDALLKSIAGSVKEFMQEKNIKLFHD